MAAFPRLSPIFAPDLSAKIRWRMRFDRNPLFVTLQDKLAVQEYARERGVGCAPLLHATADPTTIPFDSLPPDCMIKATHGWRWNIARFDSRFYMFGDGSTLTMARDPTPDPSRDARRPITIPEVVATCQQWLRSRHNSKEWAYQRMTPRIIVEEMLVPRHGPELLDYRMYTFRGDVRAINIGSARFRRDKSNVFLRPDWSVVPLTRYVESLPESIPSCPSTLPRMVEIARRLGEGLDFVRIDLYDTTQGVLLGEMTIYPNAGRRGRPSGCPVLDLWLGSQWRMRPAAHCATVGWNVIDWAAESWRELSQRIRGRPSAKPQNAQR